MVRAVLRLPGAEFRYRLIPAYHLDFRRLFLTTAQRAFLDVDLFNYGLHSGETSLSLCIFSRYAVLCYPHSTTGSAINQPTWRQELNGHKIPLAPAHLRTWTQGWDLQSPRSPGLTGFTWTSRFLVSVKIAKFYQFYVKDHLLLILFRTSLTQVSEVAFPSTR